MGNTREFEISALYFLQNFRFCCGKKTCKEKALGYFRVPPERLNCAQASLKAFEGLSSEVTPQRIAEFHGMGGGRSEGGCCGAIHAAKTVLKDVRKIDALEKHFVEIAGSTKCKEIRHFNRLTCAQCVGAAAEFVESQIA